MLIFISEFLTSGAWTGDVPPSLLREGRAMLRAIVSDFARLPGSRVVVTWDDKLGPCPNFDAEDSAIEVQRVGNPAEEARAFETLCRRADAAFLIAPEFQNLLADRCRLVEHSGTVSLNVSVEAIRQCTDKYHLSRHLEALEIPTIPTREVFDPRNLPRDEWDFPLVIKPRDGAGSQQISLLENKADFEQWRQRAEDQEPKVQWILQPYIPGRALSIAAIVGEELEIFPLAEQRLTADGRFGYLGGRVPAANSLQDIAASRVRQAVATLPGLSGYVGFDLLAPEDDPENLRIVEINPRLTTSYLGYHALAKDNLAAYFLPAFRPPRPIRWKPGLVEFSAEGVVRELA